MQHRFVRERLSRAIVERSIIGRGWFLGKGVLGIQVITSARTFPTRIMKIHFFSIANGEDTCSK